MRWSCINVLAWMVKTICASGWNTSIGHCTSKATAAATKREREVSLRVLLLSYFVVCVVFSVVVFFPTYNLWKYHSRWVREIHIKSFASMVNWIDNYSLPHRKEKLIDAICASTERNHTDLLIEFERYYDRKFSTSVYFCEFVPWFLLFSPKSE